MLSVAPVQSPLTRMRMRQAGSAYPGVCVETRMAVKELGTAMRSSSGRSKNIVYEQRYLRIDRKAAKTRALFERQVTFKERASPALEP